MHVWRLLQILKQSNLIQMKNEFWRQFTLDNSSNSCAFLVTKQTDAQVARRSLLWKGLAGAQLFLFLDHSRYKWFLLLLQKLKWPKIFICKSDIFFYLQKDIKQFHSKASCWLMQILHCFEFLSSKLAEQNSKSCKICISQHDALECNTFTNKFDILKIGVPDFSA